MSVIIIPSNSYTNFQKRIVETSFDAIKSYDIFGKSRHTAIITRGKKIIAVGVNDTKRTHPLSRKIGNFIHAELAAIIKIRHYDLDYNKYSLYSVRINRYNKVVNAKPCKYCSQLMYDMFPFGNIYYTIDNGRFVKL
jgi:deoxycytidylate deaminase